MSESSNKEWQEQIESISGSIAAFGFLGAVAIVGYQIFQWLKTGSWMEMPFLNLFIWLDIDLSSIQNLEWEGVKKILVWVLTEIPLAFVVIGVGIGLSVLFREIGLAFSNDGGL